MMGSMKDINLFFLQENKGTGEMVPWLRSLVTLVEDLGIIPTTHIASHKQS